MPGEELRAEAPRQKRRSYSRLTAMLVRVRVAGSIPVGLRVRRNWRFKAIDLLPRREGTSRNGWQPMADALLTMELHRQLVAAGGNGFRLSRVLRVQPICR
jgi:hypothetical protein